jgi:ERF superfamily.
MTIYEKLNEARVQFQSRGIRMSGKNKFANYEYYELSDIMPVINQLAKEIGFTCVVSFGDTATLQIVDTAKPDDRIFFTSPMSTAELKGCHPVQCLGAVETYIRRYLYQTAFEIVESDGLNATHNPEPKTEKPKEQPDTAKRDALIKEIGNVMIAMTPDGKEVFSEADKNAVREIIKKTGAYSQGIKNLQDELNKQKRMLAERLEVKPEQGEIF